MLITKQLVQDELAQRSEEGADVAAITPMVEAADPNDYAGLAELLTRMETLTPDADLTAREPSDLETIRELRPCGPRRYAGAFARDRLRDKLHGAWLGRVAGCMLGKPCEGWSHDLIQAYLEAAGEYPLRGYFPLIAPYPTAAPGTKPRALNVYRGFINGAPKDDDTDYTILGLHILEEHGTNFTTEDVAAEWLAHMPYHQVYTAERVAYQNLVNGLQPPETATHANPYREWIGAQIRADMWGYVSPGRPELAATLGYRDARLSHVKNGIYGEMWAAACVAAAFVEDDPRKVILAGLSEIPARCRLAEALQMTMKWANEDDDWQDTWAKVNRDYGSYHVVHTINNACAVALALLHSGGDFTKAITISVMCGWDTDCNGATAGSLMGAMLGADAIPEQWTEPLNDTLESAGYGFGLCRISDLAARTLDQASLVLASGL